MFAVRKALGRYSLRNQVTGIPQCQSSTRFIRMQSWLVVMVGAFANFDASRTAIDSSKCESTEAGPVETPHLEY